ncbi:DUF6090 family protein [Algoriphagus namhaensis]|uniref:DUF6090 family protein n=1 Tax=Algoriphagus namhaensis TaxID=915353 RepID=A0ABV8AVK7_9BACT
MIKFFRKIRQDLLSGGQTGKYLKYAIGEIVLVVIGILIALQINTWNEEQKANKLENVYLQRLKKDLVADTLYLTKRLRYVKEERTKIYNFIHEIYNTQTTEEEFKRLFSMQSFDAENLVMQTSTFEELKSTGLIDIIQNESIKIAMIDLYREYVVSAEHFNEINYFTANSHFAKSAHVASKYFNPDLYDEKGLFEGTDWTFINDPSSENFKLLENTQGGYFIKYGFFIGHFENLISKSKSLIGQLNEELIERKK